MLDSLRRGEDARQRRGPVCWRERRWHHPEPSGRLERGRPVVHGPRLVTFYALTYAFWARHRSGHDRRLPGDRGHRRQLPVPDAGCGHGPPRPLRLRHRTPWRRPVDPPAAAAHPIRRGDRQWKESLSDLAWPDYDRRVRDGAMVLVPVGALEQHGPHMSMNPDVLRPTAIGERVAGNVGGLVAPRSPMDTSPSSDGGANHMPGNTCPDGQTMISLVRDVLRELAWHGVRCGAGNEITRTRCSSPFEGVDWSSANSAGAGSTISLHHPSPTGISIDEATIRDLCRRLPRLGGRWRRSGNVPDAAPAPAAGEHDLVPDHPPAKFPLRPFPVKLNHSCVGLPVIGQRATAEYGELLLKVAAFPLPRGRFQASCRLFLDARPHAAGGSFFHVRWGWTEPTVGENMANRSPDRPWPGSPCPRRPRASVLVESP